MNAQSIEDLSIVAWLPLERRGPAGTGAVEYESGGGGGSYAETAEAMPAHAEFIARCLDNRPAMTAAAS